MRDFLQNNYKFDVLITNPPFSLKEKVFEKCLQELDNTNEFILILPETFIFSVAFYNLLMKYYLFPYLKSLIFSLCFVSHI